MESQEKRLFFMQEALKEAKEALASGEVPIGAVLTKEGEIISRAHNQTIALADPTAHAEILALRQAAIIFKNHRLLDTTLYVTLEPCLMCAGAIIQARIAHLVFGAEDFKAGAVTSLYNILEDKRLNHHPKVTPGVLKDESLELIQRFFQARR